MKIPSSINRLAPQHFLEFYEIFDIMYLIKLDLLK